jgi:hypothetical protein
VGGEHGEHAGADEVEPEVRPRLGREPPTLRRDERGEDEQRPEHLHDLVHEDPPWRAVVGPGTARALVRSAATAAAHRG